MKVVGNKKRKPNIIFATVFCVVTMLVTFSACAPSGDVSEIYKTYESDVIGAYNAVIDTFNCQDASIITSEITGSGYSVVVIDDASAVKYFLDSDLKITSQNGNLTVDEENVTSNIDKFYEIALNHFKLTAGEVSSFDISSVDYMGETVKVVDVTVRGVKHTVMIDEVTCEVVNSSIKLNSDESDGSSYISENRAKEIALSCFENFNGDMDGVHVLADKRYNDKIYKVKFSEVDYDYEIRVGAISGEIERFERSLSQETVLSDAVPSEISSERALQIATDFVGAQLGPEAPKKVKLDFEDSGFVYEVEFSHGGFEYEFEINPKTGDIIDFNVNSKDDDDGDKPNYRTEREAIEKVLSLTRNKGVIVAVDVIGREDGFCYEITVSDEFFVEQTFILDAEDLDLVDDIKSEHGPHPDSSRFISAEDALKIALKCACVTEKEIKSRNVTLKNEKEEPYYSVKFSVKSFNYSFKIDAISGEIIATNSIVD